MLKALALGLRRYAPVSRRSLDHVTRELGATRRQVELLGREERSRVKDLVTLVAALQQQCQDILNELRSVNERVVQLTLRESQLRAVLRREAELDIDEERFQYIVTKS